MSRIFVIVSVAMICLALLFSGIMCKSSSEAPASFVAYGATNTDDKIKWRNWDESLFTDAQKDSRLIFLFLSPAWCTPCDRMEKEVLSTDNVAALVNQNYLPVKIDADRYPNLYDRYHLGGYPTCVVLTPDARVIGGGNYLPVDSLTMLLSQIDEYWKNKREMVLGQADKLQGLYEQAAKYRKSQPLSEIAILQAESVVKRQYDSTYGGFFTQPKFPQPDVNEFMFSAVGPAGGPIFKPEVIKTLDAQLGLLDTVWGGFYRYAAFADWTGPSCEKLLDLNAKLLSNYLDGFQLARDDKYKRAAELTIGYFDRFLRGADGWGFYNSQQGTVKGGKVADSKAYFALSNDERLKLGVPTIDSSIYTEPNCDAVRAYLKAMRVLGRQDCADYAVKTLEQLTAKALATDGSVAHDPLRPAQSAHSLLPDQVAMLQAFLDAFETLGNRDYLTRAEKIARYVSENMVDHDSGGVYYEPSVAGRLGRMSVPVKPYNYNCDVVVAMLRLSYLTAVDEYRQVALNTVKSLFSTPLQDNDLRLCKLASAFQWGRHIPIKFVMVGKPGADYRALQQSVWKTWFPRAVFVPLATGVDKLELGTLKFPATDKPTLFVCVDTLRSEAIDDTATVTDKIRIFLYGK